MTTMRVLVTRPLERAAPLKEKLEGLGFEVALAPLLTISRIDLDIPEVPLQGVIFTSVQGVEAVKDRDNLKIFPAFAVGSKTAGAALSAGFAKVHNADGDADALLELILSSCNPGKGLLLHLAGENTVGNLVPRLKAKGFEASSRTVYKAQAAGGLPSNVTEKLENRQVDAVLFFSTRTAGIFAEIAAHKNLFAYLDRVQCLCLSENIARETEALPWRKVYFAPEPTEQSLIELLQARVK